ncbi:MAG TPA: EAL domain-containing protein [Burkholderiales bacterium]|nr:EAL domain-containing protein [Burkholderiales bacterium]
MRTSAQKKNGRKAVAAAGVRAAARPRQTPERFRQTFDLAGIGIAHISLEGVMLRVNPRLAQMFGYTARELVGRTVASLSHPEDVHVSDEERRRLRAGEADSVRFEKRYLRKDGSVLWAAVTIALAYDGAEPYDISFVEDIGARRRDEALLRLEHLVTRRLADADTESAGLRLVLEEICQAEGWVSGRYFAVDEAAGLLRYAESWGKADPLVDEFLRESRTMTYAKGQALSGWSWEKGAPLWVAEISKDPRATAPARALRGGALTLPVIAGGRTLGVMSFHRPQRLEPDERLLRALQVIATQVGQFLQRKRSESVLRESEERFRSLVELSADWYWEQDADMRFVRLDGPDIGGMPAANAVGRRASELPGVEPVSANWEEHRALIAAREPFRGVEYAVTGRDGQVQYLEVSGEPLFADDGTLRGYRGLGRDITARKRAEMERERIARLYAALSGLNELVARALSVHELLQGACELAVSSGNFQLALVRMAQPGSSLAAVVACAGGQAPWTDRPIDVRPGSPDSESLVARAYRSGQPMLSSHIDLPAGNFVARAAADTGTRSAGAFPLHRHGRCVGAMLVRSRDADAFEGDVAALLERMAGTVSRGLDALEAAEEVHRFRLALDNSADTVALVDVETLRFLDVNDTLCRATGYTREEMLAKRVPDLLPYSADEIRAAYDALIAEPSKPGFIRTHYKCKDGSTMPFESTRRVVRSGGRWILVAVSRDTRERDAGEAERAAMRERDHALVSALGEIIYEWRPPTDVFSWEGDYTRVLGYSDEEIGNDGASWDGRVHPDDLPGALAELEAVRRERRNYDLQYRLRRRDGRYVWVHDRGVCTFDADGRLVRVIGVLADVDSRKQAEQRIEHLANHDALTGLPNRTLLRDRVEQAISRARRVSGHVGLMFVDLDQFKLVNDSWGHLAGDALLLEVGRRLRETVRDGDTVARLGGDEFVLLLPELTRPGDASVVASKVAEALAKPMVIEGREMRTSASIGIGLFPGDGADLESLLQCADAAMYRAKEAGRSNFQFYSAEMGAQARSRVELEGGLRRALERGELRLHYQPQVDLVSGEIRAFEALLRWQHPVRGMISPGEFIPVAEDSGLIVPIGQWALREACRETAEWAAAGLGSMKVSVNLSARQFWRGGVTEAVRAALSESGLEPWQLELEITESVVAKDLKQVMLTLEHLRRMGVTVAIDDFGTGYSSLAYLRSLPIQKLKIDRSFIIDTPDDPGASALVAEIVRLAHVLSLEVVAEGVETDRQAVFLRDAGCEAMQGFLFSRALPAAGCAQLLRGRRRLSVGH